MDLPEHIEWQLIVDHLPSMVAYWDDTLTCRAANRAYEVWFGVAPEALRGRTLRELLGETLFSLNRPYIEGALAGVPQRFERVVPGPGGERRHSIARYLPDIEAGRVRGFIAYVIDVSQLIDTQSELQRTIDSLRAEIARRQAAEARAQSLEDVLAKTLQGLGAGFIATDAQGTITQINEIASNVFEYPSDEAIGKPFMDVYRREDRPALQEQRNPVDELAVRSIEASGAHYVMALSKRGQRVPIELRVGLIRNGEGHPSGLFALVKEQTALHEAERRLEFMEFRLDAIADASPNALFIVDTEGHIRFVNNTAERLTGYSRAELISMKVDELVPEKSRQAHYSHRALYQTTQNSRAMGSGPGDLLLKRRGSELVPVEVGLSPVRSDSSTFTLATVTDITERKQAQEALRRNNESLEQFAYVASHDLKAPLRIVASFAQLLTQRYRGQLDEKADSYLDHIVASAKQMQTLIDDLLHFSRVGATVPLVPVDAQLIWKNLWAAHKAPLEAQGATATADSLPRVLSTEALLGDVFQNLLSNSVKFRSAAPLRLWIHAERMDKMVRFTFKDNGIGISPQHHAKIFQMFQRLHSRAEYEGSGIGLSIVRRIIESHGGQIWLDSAPGAGTTFYFTLPAAD